MDCRRSHDRHIEDQIEVLDGHGEAVVTQITSSCHPVERNEPTKYRILNDTDQMSNMSCEGPAEKYRVSAHIEAKYPTTSTYQYDELRSLRPIRLLVLEPSEDLSPPLKCSLLTTDLTEEPGDEALSYVWGDGPYDNIQLNNVAVPVRKNVLEMLTNYAARNSLGPFGMILCVSISKTSKKRINKCGTCNMSIRLPNMYLCGWERLDKIQLLYTHTYVRGKSGK